MTSNLSQKDFLKNSIKELGLNRRTFCKKLSIPNNKIKFMMLDNHDDNFIMLSPEMYALIREVVREHKAKESKLDINNGFNLGVVNG